MSASSALYLHARRLRRHRIC